MKINVNSIASGKISKEESEALLHYFEDGGSWQQLLNLSSEQLEEVYIKGNDHYEKQEFDEALTLFISLIQVNPYIERHWLGFGAALHGKEQYREALSAYEIALNLNEKSVSALFFSAQAAWRLNDRVLCKDFLLKITKTRVETEEERNYLDQAHNLLRSM